MSWRNPAFTYLGAATHADPTAFARRMKARIRIADAQRKAEAQQERSTKVRVIRKAAQ